MKITPLNLSIISSTMFALSLFSEAKSGLDFGIFHFIFFMIMFYSLISLASQ